MATSLSQVQKSSKSPMLSNVTSVLDAELSTDFLERADRIAFCCSYADCPGNAFVATIVYKIRYTEKERNGITFLVAIVTSSFTVRITLR